MEVTFTGCMRASESKQYKKGCESRFVSTSKVYKLWLWISMSICIWIWPR